MLQATQTEIILESGLLSLLLKLLIISYPKFLVPHRWILLKVKSLNAILGHSIDGFGETFFKLSV